MKSRFPYFIIAVVVMAADQLTKAWAIAKLKPVVLLEVIPGFFRLVYATNRGVAFSMFADAGGWQRYFFIGVAILASAWVLWLLKKHPRQKLFCLSLAMILGGAIGNLIDRVLFGSVADFVQVHYGGYFFPAFNVADSAITVGAGLMIWDGLFPKRSDVIEST